MLSVFVTKFPFSKYQEVYDQLEQDFATLDVPLLLKSVFEGPEVPPEDDKNIVALALAVVGGVLLIMFVFLAIAYYMRVSK